MRAGALFVAGLALAANLAEAAPIRLGVADGRGASRVDLAIGAAPFSLERVGARQIDLVVEGLDAGVDISTLSGAAAGRRVENVRLAQAEGATRLRFTLACDCGYATRLAGGVLAIEFRDPPEVADLAGLELEDRPVSARAALTKRAAPRFAPEPRPRGSAAAAARFDEQSGPPAEEELLVAREKLLEQLSRAADQGLLEFRSPAAAASVPAPSPEEPKAAEKPTDVEVVEAKPSSDVEPVAGEAEEMASAETDAPEPPMELPVRARTAVDKAFRADRAETLVATPCIDDARLDARQWPDAAAFPRERARLAADLVEDDGALSPRVLTDLVRLYVAAGLGTEARALIRLHPEDVEAAALLMDFASIVDGRKPAPRGPIVTAGPCGGLAAIWFLSAGLTAPEDVEAMKFATGRRADEIVMAFAETPAPLRVILGPMLVTALLNRGEVALARRIDLILRRMPGDHGPAFDLARARVMALSEATDEAEALYSRLAHRDLPEARMALLLLLDARVARGNRIGVALADALGEAAFTARGGPQERALKIAEIRARAKAEGFATALETVREAIERQPENATLLRDAGHAVLEEGEAETIGPLAYLRAVLAHQNHIATDAAGDAARSRVAEELTLVGLGNAALTIIEPSLARGAPGPRLAAARAHLALDDAEAARAALGDLEGPAASRVRAEIEEKEGRPNAALEIMSAIGAPPEEREPLAYAAGAEEASKSGPPEARLLAAAMAGPAGADIDRGGFDDEPSDSVSAFLDPPRMSDPPTLAAAQEVMDASRAVRAVIKEALNDG